ncbi:MAG: tetraacyldisaccharide 4'-kinase [Porphyromonadaceae bacterium]|nr:tetraacyldisaccharide 4'-kinase [Porphyromonadaceae bacterium]
MDPLQDAPSIKLYPILAPFAWLYGMIIWIRNRLYDWHILPSESFDIPVISVGNITVGGTGKTPHVEYLIRMLSEASYRIAVLSRGYGRHTRGFHEVKMTSTAREVGDEPLQIKHKFPDITVAVDANRRRGIRKLEAMRGIDIVLLDDAYQHRSVIPAVSILLTNYERMIYKDKIMPMGRLRESIDEKHRAHMVIVTKCPKDLRPIDYRILGKYLCLFPYQNLFYTGLQYDELQPVFVTENVERISLERFCNEPGEVLIVTGISSPQQLTEHIGEYTFRTRLWEFGDHHEFSEHDLERIEEWVTYATEAGEKGYVLITEKDAARLINNPAVSPILRRHLYYLPLHIHFLLDQKETFDKQLKEAITRFRCNVSQKK